MKWGIFGGTFDPVHFGHLRCAQEICECFELDKVIFIPAARQPLKKQKNITPFFHREAMIKKAIATNPFFACSDIEQHRQGKSYSIDTVRYFLSSNHENLEVFFIMGQDAFQEIQLWKDWQELLEICNVVVITRPGYKSRKLSEILPSDFASRFTYRDDKNGYEGPAGRTVYFRQLTLLDISATDIRNRTRQGKSLRYLTPESVRNYISGHALYGCPMRSRQKNS